MLLYNEEWKIRRKSCVYNCILYLIFFVVVFLSQITLFLRGFYQKTGHFFFFRTKKYTLYFIMTQNRVCIFIIKENNKMEKTNRLKFHRWQWMNESTFCCNKREEVTSFRITENKKKNYLQKVCCLFLPGDSHL